MKRPHVSPAEGHSLPAKHQPQPHRVKAAVAPSEGFLWPILWAGLAVCRMCNNGLSDAQRMNNARSA